MKAIRENVEAYTHDAQVTKDTLARNIGIGRSSFYNKLAGRSPWMLGEVIALADVMGCSVQELITERQ